jgi:hypothetical protein
VVRAGIGLLVAGQSVFAGELSTSWIVSTNGLWGVVSTVDGDAEITPPLFFVAAWLSTRVDLTPESLRAPLLVAGQRRSQLPICSSCAPVGRAAALVAASLVAVSPFIDLLLR